MKLELSPELKAKAHAGNIPAVELISFLLSNGWKSNKPADKSALFDLYTDCLIIKGAKLDQSFLYLETVERPLMPIEKAELTEKRLFVSSASTIHVDLHAVDVPQYWHIYKRIKAIRKACRAAGCSFSAPKAAALIELYEAAQKDEAAYGDIYEAARLFWLGVVAKGLRGGICEPNPALGIEKLLYRSAPLSKWISIASRLEELEKSGISGFSKISL